MLGSWCAIILLSILLSFSLGDGWTVDFWSSVLGVINCVDFGGKFFCFWGSCFTLSSLIGSFFFEDFELASFLFYWKKKKNIMCDHMMHV